MLLLLITGLGIYSFTQFNFSYQSQSRLAHLQAALGLHQAEGGTALVIGHRGSGLPNTELTSPAERYRYPVGNTEPGIRRAIAAQVDWVEIDIRAAGDGTLLLFHDVSLDAKTDGIGKLAQQTMKQLSEVRYSVETTAPQRILTLEGFRDLFLSAMADEKIGLVLDVKQAGLSEQLVPWIRRSIDEAALHADRIAIIGTAPVIEEYQNCNVSLGLILNAGDFANGLQFLFRKGNLIEEARRVGASRLILPILFCEQSFLDLAQAAGLEIWCYGSDNDHDLGRVIGMGAGGVIVDYPVNFDRDR